MVEPHLRGVAVRWSHGAVLVQFSFDRPVTDRDRDVVSEVESELIAHFPDAEVIAKATATPPSEPLPALEAWVYRRREGASR